MKQIHKLNNGRGATLCHTCSVIITTGLTEDLYCEKCKPKQETLEEVAERLYPENWESIMDGQHDSNSYERNAFIKGAKWQQERSYSEKQMDDAYDKGFKDAEERSFSEEEVETLLETLSKVLVYQGNEYKLPHYFEYEIKQVIEQFKKK